MAHLVDSRERSPSAAVDSELRAPPRDRFVAERVTAILVAVTALAMWEWAARAGAVSALFFPAPSQVLRTLSDLISSGTLATHMAATLQRVGLGFLLGGLPGLLLGLAMGWSPRLRALVDPFVATLHPIPKIAVLPLFMMVFGLGETSKVVVIAAAVFFPMLINAMAGVRQIHPVHFEVAEAYGANPLQVCTQVVIPGSLPMLLTGARLAFNVGLLLTLAVELVAAQQGLGRMIWLAWQTMRTEELYAALFVIAGLGVGFSFALAGLTKYLAPWHIARVE
ncbi:MAG: ABC transporter permease [Vicinamibacterales bacterium]